MQVISVGKGMRRLTPQISLFIAGAAVASVVWGACLWWQRYTHWATWAIRAQGEAHAGRTLYEAHRRGQPEDTRRIAFACYKMVEGFTCAVEALEEEYPYMPQGGVLRYQYEDARRFLQEHKDEWRAEQRPPGSAQE